MRIEIKPFQEEYFPDVVRMYNNLIEAIPFNWQVTEEEFFEEVIGGVLDRI